MKPSCGFDLTWEEVQAEIGSLPKAGATRTVLDSLTENQRVILVKARESDRQWCEVVKWWSAKGWPGTETTLLKVYRQLKDQGY